MSKNSFNHYLENLYLANKDKIEKILNYRKYYSYYDKEKKLITEDIVVCPICGYLKSTIVQHMKNNHNIRKKEFYELYENFRLTSINFNKRAIENNNIRPEILKKMSDRMKKDNPCYDIKVREKISKSRKARYRNDKDFRERMKILRDNNLHNAIKKDGDSFKIAGWGVGGSYKNIYFRSVNELKALIYFDLNNMLNEIEPNYKIESEKEIYFCDFKLRNKLIEVKHKSYALDERESKQFKLLKEQESKGFDIFIWTSKSEEIKSISYFDILKEYNNKHIIFAKNKEHYALVKKLKNERNKN